MRRIGSSFLLAALGCNVQSQADVAFPISVAGTEIAAPIVGRDGVEITLDRARLAFGPLYLCAGTQAGELCETARLEWLDAKTVDALDPAVDEAGLLEGVTGNVRSWMFDLGYTSLLTHDEPLVLPAARSLGGSVRIEGRALVEGVPLPFAASLTIQQEEGTEQGVPIARSSPASRIDEEVTEDQAGLLVRFDAAPWVSDIDFLALRQQGDCTADGPPVTCMGETEQLCDTDGTVLDTRDCTETGQLCIWGQGCTDLIDFDDDSQGGRSIRTQIVAGPAPRFTWDVAP